MRHSSEVSWEAWPRLDHTFYAIPLDVNGVKHVSILEENISELSIKEILK